MTAKCKLIEATSHPHGDNQTLCLNLESSVIQTSYPGFVFPMEPQKISVILQKPQAEGREQRSVVTPSRGTQRGELLSRQREQRGETEGLNFRSKSTLTLMSPTQRTQGGRSHGS